MIAVELVDKLMTRLLSFRDLSPKDLQSIQAPALVMIGDADIIRPEHAVEMAHPIPHAQLAVFPNADRGAFLGEVSASEHWEYGQTAAVAMVEAFLHGPVPAGR